MKVEKRKSNKKYKIKKDKKLRKLSKHFLNFYFYVFRSLTDRPTDKIFVDSIREAH